MRLTAEQERRLARGKNLSDDNGNLVRPSDLDREVVTPIPKKEVDKQLQALQHTMDAMMQFAKQSELNRRSIMESMSSIKPPHIPAPVVNVKAIMPTDDWTEVESEITDRDNLGRIKKITHRRIN